MSEIMKHKVAELEGALLDAAVAKAEGVAVSFIEDEDDGQLTKYCVYANDDLSSYAPSRQPMLSSPIIDRERISIVARSGGEQGGDWLAFLDSGSSAAHHQTGPTHLVAGMRAFVASRLGEEVELP